MEALVKGKRIMVVSPSYVKENFDHNDNYPVNDQNQTHVYVLVNKKVVGRIILTDKIRPESYDTIRQLQEKGIKCLMLTGDNLEVAKWLAKE